MSLSFTFLEIMQQNNKLLKFLFNFTFTPTSVHIYGVAFIRTGNLVFKDPRLLIKVTGYCLNDRGSMPSRMDPYLYPACFHGVLPKPLYVCKHAVAERCGQTLATNSTYQKKNYK